VVDDNAQNRQFLADLLQPIGFVITEAADGLAAQSLLKQSRFDLIITDLVMPEVDGFELVSWIRNSLSDAQTPIIVASASAFYDDQIRSLSAGANQFMPKPVDPFELLGRVAKLLNFEFAEDESVTDRANEANSVIDSVIDWQEPTNQSLRRAMLDAANLGQMQKIEQLLESIQDEQRKAQWLKLVGDALDDHDDERIIEVLESVDA